MGRKRKEKGGRKERKKREAAPLPAPLSGVAGGGDVRVLVEGVAVAI